jgi:hypothetical protein
VILGGSLEGHKRAHVDASQPDHYRAGSDRPNARRRVASLNRLRTKRRRVATQTLH